MNTLEQMAELGWVLEDPKLPGVYVNRRASTERTWRSNENQALVEHLAKEVVDVERENSERLSEH